MGSFGIFHVAIIIAAGAIIYYFIFRPDVHLILPDELKSIEDDIIEIVIVDPMDCEFIVKRKEELREDIAKCNHLFKRNPPAFSKKEAEALRGMADEMRQILRNGCASMETIKESIEKALAAAIKAEDALKKVINMEKEEGTTGDDEAEDNLDNLEAMLESMESNVLKHTQEKQKLEYSIVKYKSL